MEVVGPIARTVADAQLMLEVLSGPDVADRDSLLCAAVRERVPRRPRILYVPRIGAAPVDPAIAAHVDAAAAELEALGFEVASGDLPLPIDELTDAWPDIARVGIARALRGYGQRADLAGDNARALASAGEGCAAVRLFEIIELIASLRARAAAVFESWDVILSPAAAALPWPAAEAWPERIDGQPVGPRGHAVYSGWVNACGNPAVSLPCTPSADGLPIGVQLVARYGCDRALLALAARFEARAPWADRWPSLVTV